MPRAASHWSLFGHAVLLIGIQIGGLGVMTILSLFPLLRGSVSSRCIPAEGTYTYKTIDKMCVLVADLPAVRRNLRESFPE